MNAEIEKFYISENSYPNKKGEYWQHKCGLFHWHISGSNVSLSCQDPDLEKITWPNIDRKEIPGGP